MSKNNKAFTLVELIVVITILAVIGTIGILSFYGYLKSARNSIRISDINSIEKSLELFFVINTRYPYPSDYQEVTYSGAIAWYQGTVSQSVLQEIRSLNNIPLDPLTNIPYTYSINNYRNKLQIATIQEITDTNSTAIIKGNYQGVVTNAKSLLNTHILAVPSIIASDLSSLDLIDIISNKKLMYGGKKNLPMSFSGSNLKNDGGFDFTPNVLLIYSAPLGFLQNNRTERLAFIQRVQDAYTGSTISSNSRMLFVTKADLRNTLRADILAVSLIGGGAVPTITPTSVVFVNNFGATYICPSCD